VYAPDFRDDNSSQRMPMIETRLESRNENNEYAKEEEDYTEKYS